MTTEGREQARDALAHARLHNEHATRPNQHDEAWASREIHCPPGREHAPLYRRQNGLHGYDCVCEWQTFDCDTESRAWAYYVEHHRGETGQTPSATARKVST